MKNPAEVHASAIVIDGHADTPQRFCDESWNWTDPLGDRWTTGHLNLETARAGGLTAEFFAVWVDPLEWRGRYAERALALFESVHQQIKQHPGSMRLGTTAADIRQAKADGVFCALLGVEGGHAIENSLDLLRRYFDLGARYMTLTWTNTHEWADSSGDLSDTTVQHHGGLTEFGREVVREMNRLGMMVDVSHVADATFTDVLRTTRAPVIASHSSARALCDIPRNMSDEQLRAVATNNGVVMVNFYASFLDQRWHDAWSRTAEDRHLLAEQAAQPFRERNQPVPYAVPLAVDRRYFAEHAEQLGPLAPFSSLIDHIDHIAQVAGIDHVGLGSDFDGFSLLPQGMASAADLPCITAVLAKRGYTDHHLHKLLGGNLLRVMQQVETFSASAQ